MKRDTDSIDVCGAVPLGERVAEKVLRIPLCHTIRRSTNYPSTVTTGFRDETVMLRRLIGDLRQLALAARAIKIVSLSQDVIELFEVPVVAQPITLDVACLPTYQRFWPSPIAYGKCCTT